MPLQTNISFLDMKWTVQGICKFLKSGNVLRTEGSITLKTVLYHGLKKEEKVRSVLRKLLKVLKQENKQKKIKMMV